jgi:hypothetical protein
MSQGLRARHRETRFFFIPRQYRRKIRRSIERRLLSFERVRGIDHSAKPRFPDGSERIYFHHIRKTAGTSLARSFLALGGEDPMILEHRMKESFFTRATSNGLVFVTVMGMDRPEVLRDGNYFFGWSHLTARALPLPERTFTFTVLRDPVARVVSYYRYLVAGDSDEEPFRLTNEERAMAEGGFSAFLGRIPTQDLFAQLYKFSETLDVDEAVEGLRQCSMVLTTERLQEGVADLSRRLALPLVVRRDRVTRQVAEPVDEKFLVVLRERLQPEYEFMAKAGLPT